MWPVRPKWPLLGGTCSKGIYYGRWSVRHTNFAATLRQEGTYKPGGLIAKGGLINQFIRYLKINPLAPAWKLECSEHPEWWYKQIISIDLL